MDTQQPATHAAENDAAKNPAETCPWRRSNPCRCACHMVPSRPMPEGHICVIPPGKTRGGA